MRMGNEAIPGPRRSRRPLKVGLILPQWTGSYGGADPRWADLLAVARRAEDVGFDSLWAIDDLHLHFDGTPVGVWECWAVVAGLAAATERVELGTLVCSNNFRSPAVLAKIADTLEEISGDRLILGLGAGGDEGEHRAFGLPWERRFDRLGEALAIVSELLRTGRSDFAGEHYRLDGCQLVPRGSHRGGPPLLIGATSPGPRMLGFIARYADLWNGWLAFGESTPAAVLPVRDALDAACRAIGRDPATLRRTVAVGVVLPGNRLTFGSWEVTSGALTGAPEEIAAALSGFATEGIDHVQVALAPCTLAGVERFAPILELLDRS
jgi:alkanesulfonate monooxygenase SsuD/methylene tetrahydromethanopterin reductase-like flavin-dependent oxidoreductase (luciferase family)